jgi:hypothetical protein
MFQSSNPTLIIINCQKAIDSFDTSTRSNPDAELCIQVLLKKWRDLGLPVIHIRHSSCDEGSPYHASKSTFKFKDLVAPLETEIVIT